MNIGKITNFSTALIKFHQYLPVFRPVTNALKDRGPSKIISFSHFCNPIRTEPASKLIQAPASVFLNNSRGYKMRGHLQLRCKDCYIVRKDGQLFVECASYPRHKQMKIGRRNKYSWILTYAFQSKKRPY